MLWFINNKCDIVILLLSTVHIYQEMENYNDKSVLNLKKKIISYSVRMVFQGFFQVFFFKGFSYWDKIDCGAFQEIQQTHQFRGFYVHRSYVNMYPVSTSLSTFQNTTQTGSFFHIRALLGIPYTTFSWLPLRTRYLWRLFYWAFQNLKSFPNWMGKEKYDNSLAIYRACRFHFYASTPLNKKLFCHVEYRTLIIWKCFVLEEETFLF